MVGRFSRPAIPGVGSGAAGGAPAPLSAAAASGTDHSAPIRRVWAHAARRGPRAEPRLRALYFAPLLHEPLALGPLRFEAGACTAARQLRLARLVDRKSTRLNSSHLCI